MPLFTVLVDRLRYQGAGVHGVSVDPDALLARLPPEDRPWTAWAHAQAAFIQGMPGKADAWLRAASAELEATPDPLCEAEVDALWLDLWDAASEPRSAIQYALRAWQEWLALASGGLSSDPLPSIRRLLRALTRDESESPTDDELLFEWIYDRQTRQMLHVFQRTVRLCGTLGARDAGESTVAQMRDWMAKYMVHLPEAFRAAPWGAVFEDVGNLYDSLGEVRKAYDAFMEGDALLQSAVDALDVARQRARLRFNAANQLAKLGEHVRAIELFADAHAEFLRLGMHEAVLRVRHASLVSQWHAGTGATETLLRDVEELIIAYEARPPDVSDGVLRMNLDSAYRLWLTLTTPLIANDELLTHRYLAQLYALREGLTDSMTAWRRDVGATGKTILSEVAILAARFARQERSVLLLFETGVGRLLLTTLRGGSGPLAERVRSAVASEEFGTAIEKLLRTRRAATDALVDRAIPIKSPPPERFLAACRDAWATLPSEIRAELTRAETLVVCLSNWGDLDEVPLELLHDGDEFLGLTKGIVRVVSMRQLAASLSDNRVNVAPSGSALIVRATDVEAVGLLREASGEVADVQNCLRTLGVSARTLISPSSVDMLSELGAGHDVFHYVGHGFADENGEELLLGDRESVTAMDLMTLGPAPAPFCVASSCLVGRARHLDTGYQRGVAVALLDRGAPAIVAATLEVPDRLGRDFVLAFYAESARAPLREAMLATRRRLAAVGYHPAAWACFAMFGDPRAGLLRANPQPHWPELLVRCAATESARYREATRTAVRADPTLTPTDTAQVIALVDALGDRSAPFFSAPDRGDASALRHDAEAYLIYHLLLSFGRFRFGDPDPRGKDAAGAEFLALHRRAASMLHDSYLDVLAGLVARADIHSYMTAHGRRIMRDAISAARWLQNDGELSATRTLLQQEVFA
jgi:tetratricopeptide (TPR) repeat protein